VGLVELVVVEAIVEALADLLKTRAELISTPSVELGKRHQEERHCFKCQKNGHRTFRCPELKSKEPIDTPNKHK
jgi:hypothetical protein